MKGYYNRDEETRAALRDGWLYTGDLAHRDLRVIFLSLAEKKNL
jgi:long-chain acyl-CoA synthetase